MVSNSDSGKRIVVYEEGWDSVTNRADLERMVENWKLARDYGIFNVLLMHKVTDLDMAGDA
ncbi:MAG: conjugal transfer protein TraC, partial [Kocuria sp.]|nr:conjugal transfer protein TraC [Kocuria sp.]